MEKSIYQIEDQLLELTNLDKTYWPDEGYSKGDLIKYYYLISPYILPHLNERFMVMQRFPDGIAGKAFYQKECPAYAPDWILTKEVQSPSSKRKYINYIICNDLATLLWLVNQGCIEMHPWLSRWTHIDNPEAVILDLDPGDQVTFEDVLNIALLIKQVLDSFNVKGFVKTSGATGLHIYIPVKPQYSFKNVRDFAEKIARIVVAVNPAKATIERTVSKREGKVYIDYMQNVQGKTIASVFSVRPLRGATVSTPVSWEEIAKKSFAPGDFTMYNIPELIKQGRPDFSELLACRQNLPEVHF